MPKVRLSRKGNFMHLFSAGIVRAEFQQRKAARQSMWFIEETSLESRQIWFWCFDKITWSALKIGYVDVFDVTRCQDW